MPAGKHPMAFLGKKSWHTKNLRNVEKVWIAEQKEANEAKRLEELQKQIAEERQMLELKQLQQGMGGGGGGSGYAEKLDWMYEGPQAEAGDGTAETAAAEEYLLGKEFKPAATPTSEVKQLGNQPGALWTSKPPSANDAFTRMHEDPLLLIRQKQLAAREAVVKNPLKMKKVKEELERQVVQEMSLTRKVHKRKRKEAKKAKKAKKEERKAHKKRRRTSSSSSDDETPQPSRNGPPSTHEQPNHNAASSNVRGSAGDAKKYGLQSGKRADHTRRELGPSAEQLRQAAQAEEPRFKRHRTQRQPMTDEEKQRRLLEMQQDAADHEAHRRERTHHDRVANAEEERQAASAGSAGARFIRDMGHEVYSGSMGMEERIQRNRHQHQRASDLSSEGFLTRS